MTRQTKQLEWQLHSHGGKRDGAGRPRHTDLQSHVRRERVGGKKPIHVTLKVKRDVSNLRRRKYLGLFYEAARKSRKFGLRIVHFSVQSNHIHLFVETENNLDLARGMKSLSVSFAKQTNKKMNRRGSVLKDRYHMHLLRTPTETRNALKYILGNSAHHMGTRVEFDWYSSAPLFRDWKPLLGIKLTNWLEVEIMLGQDFESEIKGAYDDLKKALSPPRFWLSRKGWMRAA